LDSGGFSELTLYDGWRTPARQYAAEVGQWSERIGGMRWAAPQDWMCEPGMLAKTGLTVAEHQRRTVASIQELRALAPGLPWVPVLQGWTAADYFRCIDLYAAAGIDLASESLVGVGSVCRREGTDFVVRLIRDLSQLGLRLHGFGLKTTGVGRCGEYLTSADSMAWSSAARRRPIRLPGHRHLKCASCLTWAMQWRGRVLRQIRHADRRPVQAGLYR
jgi:hypothetical protein